MHSSNNKKLEEAIHMADELLENKAIVFKARGEEYTIPIKYEGGIEKMMPITRVPSTEPFIKGVLNVRGEVTPVVDLKQKFHQQDTNYPKHTRINVVHLDDLSVGLIVAAANDVIDIDYEELKPAPEVVGSKVDAFINGVIKMDKRLLIILDINKVLSKEDVNEFKTLE